MLCGKLRGLSQTAIEGHFFLEGHYALWTQNGRRTVTSVPKEKRNRPAVYVPFGNEYLTWLENRPKHKWVVQRRWWLPHIPNLEDVTKYPYDEHERGDFHVYDVVETEPIKTEMKVLLTTYVEGYGDIGDSITVTKDDARNFLLPAQLATYDTLENRAKIHRQLEELNMTERVQRTPFAALTARQLQERLVIPILMNPNKPWVLEKFHVIAALRKVGVVVESEDCLILPSDPVTKPSEIEVNLTVNAIDTVIVKAKILNWTIDLDGNIIYDKFDIWAKPKEKPKEWLVNSAEPVQRI